MQCQVKNEPGADTWHPPPPPPLLPLVEAEPRPGNQLLELSWSSECVCLRWYKLSETFSARESTAQHADESSNGGELLTLAQWKSFTLAIKCVPVRSQQLSELSECFVSQ